MLFTLNNLPNDCQKRRPAFNSRSHFGNTIPEYTLIALFLIFVSIAGFQMLNANLSSAMASVRDDMKSHSQAAQAALAADQAASAAAGVAGAAGSAGLSAADQALLQQSMADKIQTTGANGATELLANQLAAAAALLLQQGKVDQAQYDILMQLANQGHQMAQIQGLIADSLKAANGNYSTFSNITVLYNGQTYTAPQLAELIGLQGPAPQDFGATSILTISPTGVGTEPVIGSFLSLYNQALASGALNDPIAKATVDSAATQIASLGEVTEDNIYNYSAGVTDPTALNTLAAAQASTMSSAEICGAGSFEDNGVLCSP